MKTLPTKYDCTYVNGGGTEYNDGVWEMKKTAKTITMMKVEDYLTGVYAMHKIGEKIRVGRDTRHPFLDQGDGEYTIYFNQSGTPYHFKPRLHLLKK